MDGELSVEARGGGFYGPVWPWDLPGGVLYPGTVFLSMQNRVPAMLLTVDGKDSSESSRTGREE